MMEAQSETTIQDILHVIQVDKILFVLEKITHNNDESIRVNANEYLMAANKRFQYPKEKKCEKRKR